MYKQQSRYVERRAPIPFSLYVMFMLPFIVFGFLMLIVGVLQMREAISGRSWQPTTATITESSVESHYESGRRSCHCYMYYLKVGYSYRAGGRDYKSNRQSFENQVCVGSTCIGGEDYYGLIYEDTPEKVRAFQSQFYPLGGTLNVYYSPSNPQHAVIDRSIPTVGIILLGGGIIAFVGSIGFLIWKMPSS